MEPDDYTIINVELNKIIISKPLPKENSVEAVIFFNDGDKKEITKNIELSNPKMLSHEIISEIVKVEKNRSIKFDGKNLLESQIKVIVRDKDNIISKMNVFFSETKSHLDNLKSCRDADKLLDYVRKINKMALEF